MTTSSPQPKTPSKNTTKNGCTCGCYWHKYVLTLILLALGWLSWNSHHQQHETQAQLQHLKAHIQTAALQTVAQEKRTQNLSQDLQALRLAQQRLSVANPRAQAQFMVEMANYHLEFLHHVPQAIAWLQRAKQLLERSAPESTQHAQDLIDNTIAHLQAPNIQPLTQVLHQLDQSIERIRILPTHPAAQQNALTSPEKAATLVTSQAPPTETEFKENPLESKTWKKNSTYWHNKLVTVARRFWQMLQPSLRIQHYDDKPRPVLTPQEQAHLKQHLTMLLNQAQWAAMYRHQRVYQHSLQATMTTLRAFYDITSPALQAIITQLSSLETVNIKPQLPHVDSIFKALRPRDTESTVLMPPSSPPIATPTPQPATPAPDNTLTKPELRAEASIQPALPLHQTQPV